MQPFIAIDEFPQSALPKALRLTQPQSATAAAITAESTAAAPATDTIAGDLVKHMVKHYRTGALSARDIQSLGRRVTTDIIAGDLVKHYRTGRQGIVQWVGRTHMVVYFSDENQEEWRWIEAFVSDYSQ